MIKDEIKNYEEIRQKLFINEAKKSQQEIEEYKNISNAYQIYLQICENIASLIKDLSGDIQNDAIYMVIFNYLYRNGYLSYNKYFEFGTNKEEITCNMGLSIIMGKGVCRNIAAFFKDILMAIKGSKKGIIFVGTNIDENQDTAILSKNLPDEFKINVDKSINIENQNITKKEFIPNHAEIIVMDTSPNNNSYSLMLYDPTNIRITKIDYQSNNYQPNLTDRKALDFRCGIWDINTHLTTLDERIEFIERFMKIAKRIEGSKHQNYDKKNLELLLEYAKRQCNLHKSKIEEFYKKNSQKYSTLKDQVKIYNKMHNKLIEEKAKKIK